MPVSCIKCGQPSRLLFARAAVWIGAHFSRELRPATSEGHVSTTPGNLRLAQRKLEKGSKPACQYWKSLFARAAVGTKCYFLASCGLPLARAKCRRRQGGQREISCCRLAVAAISSASYYILLIPYYLLAIIYYILFIPTIH